MNLISQEHSWLLAAGTPIHPQGFKCGSLEGQGLQGWMLHTGDPAESLHGRDEPRGWGHRPNAPDSPVRS